jgi:hypothetical protein
LLVLYHRANAGGAMTLSDPQKEWSPRMILTFSERLSVCYRIYMGQDT